jgi:hypothetical protein
MLRVQTGSARLPGEGQPGREGQTGTTVSSVRGIEGQYRPPSPPSNCRAKCTAIV